MCRRLTLSFSLLLLLLSTDAAALNHTLSIYESILSSSCQIYGPVQKDGILPKGHFKMSEYEKGVGLNLTQYLNDPTKKLDAPPLTYPCKIYYNHQHKLIFIKSRKAASSSILALFDSSNRMNKGNATRWQFYWEPYKLQKLWMTYTVFTVVRNPWARAYSGFSFILTGGLRGRFWKCLAEYYRKGGIEGPKQDPDYDDEDSGEDEQDEDDYSTSGGGRKMLAKKKRSPETDYEEMDDEKANDNQICDSLVMLEEMGGLEGFKEFCRDPFRLARRCETYKKCVPMAYKIRMHLEPIAPCSRSESGGFALDYILRHEHLESDWDEFQKAMNRRPDVKPMNYSFPHRNAWKKPRKSGPRPAEFYQHCGLECIANIAKFCKEDLELFKFQLPHQILDLAANPTSR